MYGWYPGRLRQLLRPVQRPCDSGLEPSPRRVIARRFVRDGLAGSWLKPVWGKAPGRGLIHSLGGLSTRRRTPGLVETNARKRACLRGCDARPPKFTPSSSVTTPPKLPLLAAKNTEGLKGLKGSSGAVRGSSGTKPGLRPAPGLWHPAMIRGTPLGLRLAIAPRTAI